MITLAILLLSVLALIVFGVLAVIAGGAGFIIVFADVIVCAIFIVFVVKRLIGK